MTTTVQNAVCPACGCLCDDLVVEVEETRVLRARRACANGQTFFQGYDPTPRQPRVHDRESEWDQAIEEAACILVQARSPLVYGLSSTATEAQRCAVELADRLGAMLDTTSSVCHGPAVLAMQSIGLPGCTLGEVRNSADLVIFWGSNPAVSHPRHFARYSLPPRRRKSRRAVVVDVRPTASSDVADLFLQVEPGSDFEILTTLRALIHGKPVSAQVVGGVPLADWADLASCMKGCRLGVIFAGVGLTMSQGRDLNLRELFGLVAELNDYTRFAALPMRGHGNVAGADQVLTWQSGYPFAVDFARNFPRYGPGEFSAVDVLARGEADAALIVASDPAAHLPAAAVAGLRKIPVIAIDPRESCTTRIAQVVFPTACYGIDAEGTYYRMDGVPIRLRPVISSARPTDEQALQQLLVSVARLSARAVQTC